MYYVSVKLNLKITNGMFKIFLKNFKNVLRNVWNAGEHFPNRNSMIKNIQKCYELHKTTLVIKLLLLLDKFQLFGCSRNPYKILKKRFFRSRKM